MTDFSRLIQLRDRRNQLDSEIKEAAAQLEQEIDSKTLDEVVQLVDSETPLETISVRTEGKSVVLLRSPRMPEYAFLCYATPEGSTRWRLSIQLADGISTGEFYILCGCCPLTIGLEKPEGTNEDEWATDVRRKLHQRITEVCQQHGIKVVFVRMEEYYRERLGSSEQFKVLEANKWRQAMGTLYERGVVEQAWKPIMGRGTEL